MEYAIIKPMSTAIDSLTAAFSRLTVEELNDDVKTVVFASLDDRDAIVLSTVDKAWRKAFTTLYGELTSIYYPIVKAIGGLNKVYNFPGREGTTITLQLAIKGFSDEKVVIQKDGACTVSSLTLHEANIRGPREADILDRLGRLFRKEPVGLPYKMHRPMLESRYEENKKAADITIII